MTGLSFEILPEEMALRKKLRVEGSPRFHPVFRFMQLGGFWQHWNLFKRKCDRTGQQIISVFSEDCPYPVWHKDEWIKHAAPPHADFVQGKPVFPQMWDFFRRSPIPHNVGAGNDNCEYTDDWWYSKNCYLSHSGVEDEDLRYCYRAVRQKNCQYTVFSYDSERSSDLITSHHCFQVLFAFNCYQCSDSAFLYDCRNCHHCLFCSNLRNQSYCINNQQLTREEYERRALEWDFRSHQKFTEGITEFGRMLRETAWLRATFTEQCEGCAQVDQLFQCKGCRDCYFMNEIEDSLHNFRGIKAKDCLDCVSPAVDVELLYYSSMVQDQCYDVKFGYNLVQCKWMEYCAHSFQCQHCFGCCGLTGKKHYIFNKPFSETDYEREKQRIIAAMQETGEYGLFFPGSFAANPYDESLSGFYWPLTAAQAQRFGFRLSTRKPVRPSDAKEITTIPDRSDQATDSLAKDVFWDAIAGRPFQIQKADIDFARDLGAPLPHSFYARRLQENFRMIPFTGMLRRVLCGKCRKEAETSWPKEYDGRIVCEGCYLKEVY